MNEEVESRDGVEIIYAMSIRMHNAMSRKIVDDYDGVRGYSLC